jgi:hypothetical protein
LVAPLAGYLAASEWEKIPKKKKVTFLNFEEGAGCTYKKFRAKVKMSCLFFLFIIAK